MTGGGGAGFLVLHSQHGPPSPNIAARKRADGTGVPQSAVVSTGSGGASANGQAAVCRREILGHDGTNAHDASSAPSRTRFADWPLALKSILGFWLFYALTVVARAFLGSDPWTTLENKLVVIGIGIVLTGLIYLAIAALGSRRGIRRKAMIAAVGSAIARSSWRHR